MFGENNELTEEEKTAIRERYLTAEVLDKLQKNELGLATDPTELRDLLHRTILTFDELVKAPSVMGMPLVMLMDADVVMVLRSLMGAVHAVCCDKTAEARGGGTDEDVVLSMLKQVFGDLG